MSFKHLKQTRASFFMPEKMDFWFQLLDVTHVEHKFAPRLVDQSTDHIHVTYRPPSLSCLFCNLETAFAASRSFVAGTIPAALTLMSLTWEAFLRPTDSGVASASPYLVSWLRWRLAVATAASAPLLVAVWRMTCSCWRRPLGPWPGSWSHRSYSEPSGHSGQSKHPHLCAKWRNTTHERRFIHFLLRFAWERCVSPMSPSLFSVQYWSHAAHFNFTQIFQSDRCE